MAEKPIWFTGTCDALLAKIKTWHEQYNNGKVTATRDFLDMTGKIVAMPTKRSRTIAFLKQELDNLKLIMDYYCKDISLNREIKSLCESWSRGSLTTNGLRKLELNFFPEHVELIYQTVSKARREYLSGGSIEEKIKEAAKSGKDLFEV